MLEQPIRTKVLITVLTYPTPSTKYKEIVCTGGVTESGEWIRLYPIDYRYLNPNHKFHKYQWIEIDLYPKGTAGDIRPESRRPVMESIRILGDPIPTDKNWRLRCSIIDKMPHRTLNEFKRLYDEDRTSMGIVKPIKVFDIKISEDNKEWTEKQRAIIKQINIFDISPKELRKIPYKFQYIFECEDSEKPHTALITDWELGVLFLKESKRLGSDEQAAQSVKNAFLNKVCAPDRDPRFFMGTVYPHNTWIVVGVFWPPKSLNMQVNLFN